VTLHDLFDSSDLLKGVNILSVVSEQLSLVLNGFDEKVGGGWLEISWEDFLKKTHPDKMVRPSSKHEILCGNESGAFAKEKNGWGSDRK